MTSEHEKVIYWELLELEGWRLYIAAVAEGLCFVGSQDGPYEELADWAAARMPDYELVRDGERIRPLLAELAQYLSGERQQLDHPVTYRGTPFQEQVWQALCTIPYGETRTYSDIALQIGRPSAVRAVGAAIGANPAMIYVPCHRVLGKSGALTGFRGGLDMKAKLLELERR
ncbi:methylated-DNA--[protein]-cysteine S-methyltransferase [Paenibacillus sp. 1P07SE]|uniref:methylated-DNA--[protein]-cysteine S-methyltransferase n=1 Tax=Paenibacillus sp. 1P07SE TaxID=3132209 RepID=UPI0039A7367E